MKKTILGLIVLAATMNANAQIRLGVQAAASINSPSVSGLADEVSKKAWTFNPGIVFDINLSPGLGFRPAVNYQTSNYSLQDAVPATGLPGSVPTFNTTNIVTKNVQIPLDLLIPVKMGKGKLLLSAGPVVTIGLSGEYTVTTTSQSTGAQIGVPSNANITFGNTSADLKKVDWGSRFGIGYRLGRSLDLLAQYKYGFTNTANSTGNSLKQHIVSLTASYFLIGKK